MNRIDVSVVLNIHREALMLAPTLHFLQNCAAAAKEAGIAVELIAVFDRADDATREVFRSIEMPAFCQSTTVDVDLGSLGLARNAGIERAQGEFVWTSDAHGRLTGQLQSVEGGLASISAKHAALEKHIKSQERQIAQLRGALSEVSEQFSSRQKMLVSLGEIINSEKRSKAYTPALSGGGGSGTPNEISSSYEKNLPRDVRYAWKIPELDGVIHIFHAEWFGIRAAVGSLPGDKIAISANQLLTNKAVVDLYSEITARKCKKIIIHGYSSNMSKIVLYLSRMGMARELYVVIHGNPAQWFNDQERRTAFEVLDLVKSGRVRRVHFMRSGFEFSVPNIFQPILFNMSPVIEGVGGHSEIKHGKSVVFAPGWADWRKNLYTSVLAASMLDSVDEIWIHADGVEIPNSIKNKIIHHKFLNREQTFDLMKYSTICMNASLVDCHPMVNVEAQSLGKACIRGKLHLDALEDHPYIKLTEADNVISIADIKQTIARVLAVPKDELRALTLDYQANSDIVARNRYLEFLEI
ncbi:MAG: glycosyltransferase family 2 protein [Burkholderiaceae bacterium]|jgi:glycosyltransferase involved in cell wall biosynthesis|nr:glycosyltransferase family 2 protein [Burkholderiaceae bacterium]